MNVLLGIFWLEDSIQEVGRFDRDPFLMLLSEIKWGSRKQKVSYVSLREESWLSMAIGKQNLIVWYLAV